MSALPTGQLDAREQLLATASRLMRENDTIDVSLSELSKASGLNSALVKYYFGNKGGLMRELLARDMLGVSEGLGKLTGTELDLEARFRMHIGDVVDTLYRKPYLVRLMIQLLHESTPSESKRLADDYLRPIYDTYDQLIGEGIEAGIFRPVDPTMFFFTLVGSADRFFAARVFLQYCFGEDSLTEELRDRYRAHAVDFIMAGLLKT
ncbi:MAG TPA: TetR family transcriptional regulator [Sphingomonadaceae bacterium]|nr:TetR family transcriptional regulator [Sphingomonadaceae bacterium]